MDTTLVNILLERYPDIDIFWYHWPTDGWRLPVEDFEPIIILYSDGEICSIIVRAGWKFEITSNENRQIPTPVRILCDPWFHHPKVINSRRIHNDITALPLVTAKLVEISAEDITPQFRTGLKHPTNLRKLVFEDPADYARRIHQEFC